MRLGRKTSHRIFLESMLSPSRPTLWRYAAAVGRRLVLTTEAIVDSRTTTVPEQAALDKFRKREKRKPGEQKAKVNRNGVNAASRSAPRRRG
jgi:hypothetical protein